MADASKSCTKSETRISKDDKEGTVNLQTRVVDVFEYF